MYIKNNDQEKFNNTLPCVACAYALVCKHFGTIEPINVPEFMEVTYVCKKQQELDKQIKGI